MPPPVVLVHGLATSSARTWRDTGWLDLLADAGRVTVPIDLPGHGTAAENVDPTVFDDLEAHIASQFPAEPVDAVGFSLGGQLLLAIASTDPDRFEHLVVGGVGRNLFEADEERGRRIAAAVAGDPDPADPEASHFAALAEAGDIDRDALKALISSRRRRLDAAALANVTCPVLVAIGDADFAGPADRLVEALPNAELRVLKGVDHFATPKSFDFVDAALDFLGAAPF